MCIRDRVYIGGVEQSSKSGLDTVNMSKYAEGVRIVMQHRKNASLTKEYQLKICLLYTSCSRAERTHK